MSYVRLTGLPRIPRWTPAQAISYALGEVRHPDKNYRQLCDHFASAWVWGYGGSGYESAIVHWKAIPSTFRHRGDTDPPSGALVFWDIGRFGHVALAVRPGRVASNDIRRRGKIDVVPTSEVKRRWGATYLGWTPPYLARAWGRNPHSPQAAPRPKVHLADVIAAARRDPQAVQGSTTHKQEVRIVERALADEGLLAARFVDGSFGTRTIEAYSKWQRKLGFSGSPAEPQSAANGIPGDKSLTELGDRHGFSVA